MRTLPRNARWVDWSILTGAGFFIFALALSAVFDPTIRSLHALQALIYIAVIVLSRRQNAWGFGAGCLIAAFWNYVNLFVTTFIKAGVDQLTTLLTTGTLPRPDLAIALVAAAGHFMMIVACVAGVLATRPDRRQWARFVAGGVAAVAYLVAIIYVSGPQYIPLVKRVFGLS